MINFEVPSFSSFRDIKKSHFVTVADIDDSIKRKRIRVSLNNTKLRCCKQTILALFDSSLVLFTNFYMWAQIPPLKDRNIHDCLCASFDYSIYSFPKPGKTRPDSNQQSEANGNLSPRANKPRSSLTVKNSVKENRKHNNEYDVSRADIPTETISCVEDIQSRWNITTDDTLNIKNILQYT